MRARTAVAAAASVLAMAALAAAPAGAATVTVGSLGSFGFSTSETPAFTWVNTALPEAGANVTSPINGTIVRWRVIAGKGVFRMRVLSPVGGNTYIGAGTSAPATAMGAPNESFPASLPIKAGQAIGLDTESKDVVGFATSIKGAESLFWNPPLLDGSQRIATVSLPEQMVVFNADVQPLPSIKSISPSSGSIVGGTSVVISGSDFTGASAVKFGTVPASSFSVSPDTLQITATAPPSSIAGPVDVTVTTPAGSNSPEAAGKFTYVGCQVPGLRGKKLKAARKKLKAAECKLGKVKGRGKKVIKQKPKPGTVLPPGSKVNVKLGGGK